jgi:hypothetical protein
MPLSWNEIKDRALNFSKEWEDAFNEDADAKPFLVDFFNVFGISQRKVASFEHRVKKLNEHEGYIDMLWKGMLLVEMKSRGKNLDSAYQQARDYLAGLKEHELPKYILVSDFVTLRLYDMEEEKTIEFKLKDLVDNVQHFGFISGYQKKVYKEQDPANIKAAELMGKLHDRLKEIGYEGHPLEVYLVRLLFCLFADDTTIFNKQQFQDFIELRTNEDGSDLAAKLQELFQVLNTPSEQRYKNLDEQLAEFPYVNGKLFEEMLPMPSFDSKMRKALLDCCSIDWARISPAIFGSMFQSVMNPVERRNLGAHYTSEKNILKVIKPLFLDELWEEFESIKSNAGKLRDFHSRIAGLKFLDPACGCGNFLVIAYRELRMLELEILRNLNKSGQGALDISDIVKLDVDMMYGIEIEEFPARIAEVAMWLIDHQMNMRVSNEFGQYFTRLPLKKAAKVQNADALKTDWEDVVKKDDLSFILGNPPFIGSRMMNKSQKEQLTCAFENMKNIGDLDYVTAWYIKSAKFIQRTKVRVAFVSTNSIVQGLQISILWGTLLSKYNIKIHFAHRTFKWSNEAKGNAAVYCVIVGFANYETDNKVVFDYENVKGDALKTRVLNINPYLLEGKNVIVGRQQNPICKVPKMLFGNMPADGGQFLFTTEEKNAFLENEPNAEKLFRKFLGSQEYINNIDRWCLWLTDVDPSEMKSLKLVLERVKNVQAIRKKSSRPHLANTPHLFAQITQPKGLDYIIVPSVSSERRRIIPIGFVKSNVIASNLCLIIPDASIFHFGVLTSEMHMAWVKYVCGRLESRFRYSKDIVYNNFPWPESLSEKQIEEIEHCAQAVIDERAQFPESSLADLYDPLTMPPLLLKAHQSLDKAVDLAYRPQPFASDAKRMEYLFELYEKYMAGMFGEGKKASSKIKRRNKH